MISNINNNLRRKLIVSNIINNINNIKQFGGGAKTQKTASEHELKVCNIFTKNNMEILQYNTDTKKNRTEFRTNFKKLTGLVFPKSSNKTEFKECYKIINLKPLDEYKIKKNKTYIFHQPNGQQNYPDIVLYRLNDKEIKIHFIECKQSKPTFNNTPPKNKKCCTYICGNDLFNGYYLRSQKCVDKYNQYVKDYKELNQRYNSDPEFDMDVKCYKKLEYGSKKNPWPPIYFRGKEEKSKYEIIKQLIRFID